MFMWLRQVPISSKTARLCRRTDGDQEFFTSIQPRTRTTSCENTEDEGRAFAKSGSFLLTVAIRLDSRCMRSSLVIVLASGVYPERRACRQFLPYVRVGDFASTFYATRNCWLLKMRFMRCAPEAAAKRCASPESNRSGGRANQFRAGVSPAAIERLFEAHCTCYSNLERKAARVRCLPSANSGLGKYLSEYANSSSRFVLIRMIHSPHSSVS